MSWPRDYAWLEQFWSYVVGERAGRRWVVATLFDGDLLLRDAFAFVKLREQLSEHRNVHYRYVRAFTPAMGPSLAPNEDLLLLARPKPFTSSSLSLFAARLEAKACGRFLDPGNGTTGHSIRYQGRLFTRHELETPPEHFRRCDLDYGILLHRRERIGDEEHRVVTIGGLSTLGTLGLTLILTDDARRAELIRQVRELAPWRPEHRPEESAEICVRIRVAGEDQLANILNHPEFITFRVEAVAIPPDEVHLRDDDEVELVLLPQRQGRRGGVVRVPGAAEVKLSRARFALLRLLVEGHAPATIDELRRGLELGGTGDKARASLAKLVHDTNLSLRSIPGLQHSRLVRFRRSERGEGYALIGARGTLVGEPEPPPARRPRILRAPRRHAAPARRSATRSRSHAPPPTPRPD
jgi:hypothetical protein